MGHIYIKIRFKKTAVNWKKKTTICSYFIPKLERIDVSSKETPRMYSSTLNSVQRAVSWILEHVLKDTIPVPDFYQI
jgi:hypothetical protein